MMIKGTSCPLEVIYPSRLGDIRSDMYYRFTKLGKAQSKLNLSKNLGKQKNKEGGGQQKHYRGCCVAVFDYVRLTQTLVFPSFSQVVLVG